MKIIQLSFAPKNLRVRPTMAQFPTADLPQPRPAIASPPFASSRAASSKLFLLPCGFLCESEITSGWLSLREHRGQHPLLANAIRQNNKASPASDPPGPTHSTLVRVRARYRSLPNGSSKSLQDPALV